LRHEDLNDLSFTKEEVDSIRRAEGSRVLLPFANPSSNEEPFSRKNRRGASTGFAVLVCLVMAVYGIYRLASLILK
jgi:hypothetical protein